MVRAIKTIMANANARMFDRFVHFCVDLVEQQFRILQTRYIMTSSL